MFHELCHFLCHELRAGCSSEIFSAKPMLLHSTGYADGESGTLYFKTIQKLIILSPLVQWRNVYNT